MMPELDDIQCGTPNGKELLHLKKRGVSMNALTWPWIIGAATVSFDDKAGFDFDAAGTRALIFRAEDCGTPIDLVAWNAQCFASLNGSAFCVGDLDQIFSPATWFSGDGLHIHTGPIEWLRADRAGIVILNFNLCWAYLRNVPRVICQNELIAARVHRHLKPPRCTTKILVSRSIAEKEIADESSLRVQAA